MLIEAVEKLDPWERLAYWVKEREAIRYRKELGQPPPWTDDLILANFRFCNVRRQDDRVSRWLWDNWYKPNIDHPNMVVAVVLARHLNKIDTLAAVGFPQEWTQKTRDRYRAVLHQRWEQGLSVFNSAYVIPGVKGYDKVTSALTAVSLFEEYPLQVDQSSMEKTWRQVLRYSGLGSFLAGQVVADLRWALRGDWRDKGTWAPRGPGSMRGLNYLRGWDAAHPEKWRNFTQKEFEAGLIDVRHYLAKHVSAKIAGRLEEQDRQSCLCEYSKYTRTLLGEGRPKQRYYAGDH